MGIGRPATGPDVGLPWFWGAPAVRGALRTGQARGWAGLLARCCRGRKDNGVHKGKRGVGAAEGEGEGGVSAASHRRLGASLKGVALFPTPPRPVCNQ